ncbi:hypothetical protein [Pseudaquabacterium rugosum]|jgi:hypothetical protein|uniref:Uncharacterized protein n=1 Tax=Pseudaquabacterium rugosum TaxID=2984194 RepID=A0ABU9B6P4_9BURK
MKPAAILFTVAIAVFHTPSHAYVDPGSGMLLIQGIIAAIGAFVVFIKNPIEAIKRLISRLRKK